MALSRPRTSAPRLLGRHVEVRHGDANELADLDADALVVMNRSLHEVGGPADHHDVRVLDQPRSSRVVAAGRKRA